MERKIKGGSGGTEERGRCVKVGLDFDLGACCVLMIESRNRIVGQNVWRN